MLPLPPHTPRRCFPPPPHLTLAAPCVDTMVLRAPDPAWLVARMRTPVETSA